MTVFARSSRRPRPSFGPSASRRPTARTATALVLAAAALLSVGCKKKLTEEELKAASASRFQSTCARCHGASGTGGPGVGTQAGPRNFRDAEFQRSRTDEQLREAIAKGKFPGMPGFGGAFDDDEIRGLVGVVRGFDPGANAALPAPAAASGAVVPAAVKPNGSNR